MIYDASDILIQSLYHNLPAFDGIGQHQGEQFRSKNEIYDEKSRSLTLDLTDAYESECGLLSYVRRGSLTDGVVSLNESIWRDKVRLIDFVFVSILQGLNALGAWGTEILYRIHLKINTDTLECTFNIRKE